MLYINHDVKRQAWDVLRLALDGRVREALASFTTLTMLFNDLAALSLKASGLFSQQFALNPDSDLPMITDWSQVISSSRLDWQPCFGDFTCARLQVPMDWHKNTSEANKVVDLALVRLAATVPVTHPNYGGIVLLNPGGPGGSGVGQVLRGGHAVRTLLSAGPNANQSEARYFDIVGMDPRGVNNTKPFFTCFANHQDKARWTIEKSAEGLIGDSEAAFESAWARYRGLADNCSRRLASEGIAKHMSTAVVARDIVEVFERHGEWRQAEVQRLVKASKGLSTAERDAVTSLTAYAKGNEMIQYWGLSYGTVIGAHLAAMYPNRIGRLVSDGTADAYDHMAAGWKTNLQDSDMTFVKLAEYCWLAGLKHCPLWLKGGPDAISESILRIVAEFQRVPIAVPAGSEHSSMLVTAHDLQAFIFAAVYSPLLLFPTLAQILAELGKGEATTLAAVKRKMQPSISPLSEACKKAGAFRRECHDISPVNDWQAAPGVSCSDGTSRTMQTKETYKEYVNELISQSALIGSNWAEIMAPCTAWHTRPAWRFEGSFRSKTATPILFIGNTYDGIMPLRNAVRMSQDFPGSVILQQNSVGHCSYSSPSVCTGRALRDYFQTGKLPDLDASGQTAFCEPDLLPFQGYGIGLSAPSMSNAAEAELGAAVFTLNQVWP